MWTRGDFRFQFQLCIHDVHECTCSTHTHTHTLCTFLVFRFCVRVPGLPGYPGTAPSLKLNLEINNNQFVFVSKSAAARMCEHTNRKVAH